MTELSFAERPQVVDPRTVPVRFSRLKLLRHSAQHYWDACQDDGDHDTLSKRLGRGTHAMLLGQPFTVWRGKVRNGKVWDEFKEANSDKEILNENEFEQAARMAEAITNHPDASSLLFQPGAQLERHLDWSLDGRVCSSRPDSFTTSHVAELKTARSTYPDRFVRDAQVSGYHAQLSFYREAIRTLGLGWPTTLVIVAVESKRPYSVTYFELTQRAIDIGTAMWRTWWEKLRVCEESEFWPGYAQSVIPLDVEPGLELEGFESDETQPFAPQ